MTNEKFEYSPELIADIKEWFGEEFPHFTTAAEKGDPLLSKLLASGLRKIHSVNDDDLIDYESGLTQEKIEELANAGIDLKQLGQKKMIWLEQDKRVAYRKDVYLKRNEIYSEALAQADKWQAKNPQPKKLVKSKPNKYFTDEISK